MATPNSPAPNDEMASKPLSALNVRKRKAEMPEWSLTSPPVQVCVGQGEDAKTFYVYEKQLTTHSDFFAAALGKPWKEADARLVKLPKEHAQEFTVSVNFIYTGRLHIVGPASENADGKRPEFTRICRMWIMADHLQSITLKDAVTDVLCSLIKVEKRHPTDMHVRIYKNSCGGSGIRKLIVDVAIFNWAHASWTTNKDTTPELVEFWRDAALRFAEKQHEGATTIPAHKQTEEAWCHYHDHGEGKQCYRTMFHAEDEHTSNKKK